MELVTTLIGIAIAITFFCFVAKWGAKKEKEIAELRSHIIGQHIADAIKDSVKDMSK